MKAWDVRQGFYKPMFVNKQYVRRMYFRLRELLYSAHYSFDAGITTIQSHPNVEHLVAVGRYFPFSSEAKRIFSFVFLTQLRQ
jgi:diphthamide biosynthesis protein 7